MTFRPKHGGDTFPATNFAKGALGGKPMWIQRRASKLTTTLAACLSLLLLAVICTSAGCMTDEEWRRFWDTSDKGRQPRPMPGESSDSKAVRGTIGPLITIEGLRLIQVRGFGLVVDLIDRGGKDGPEAVKKHIIKEIRRKQDIGAPGFPATEILNSLDTTLVEVTGLIPAIAKKNDRFDVVVRALGTQTRSLVGGRLVLCDLKLYAETPRGVIAGKTLATAEGPLFVSPIGLGSKPPKKIDLRTGLVLNGGIVKKPRRARLILTNPSASIASRIVNRINGRYASPIDPIAIGKGPSFIDLTIPKGYADRKRLFLEQVIHTPLIGSPAAQEKRAADLAKEIVHPDADGNAIGVTWDAIGKIALPHIRPLYNHKQPTANYFAGRAGLRLGDRRGMEVVARHARDPNSDYREDAIDELGHATKIHGAGEYLRKLLDDRETWVRIRAYKALRRRPHPSIRSTVLDQDNLILDAIDSKGPYLIYIQRALQPRIALFGKLMRCRPPLSYPDPANRRDNRRLMARINADAGAKELTIIYHNKRVNKYSPPLSAPLNVVDLVKFLGDAPDLDPSTKIDGLAIPYSELVNIFHSFCDSGTIRAEFIAEDLTGKSESDIGGKQERSESEY